MPTFGDTAKLASEKLEKIIQDAYKMTEIIQDTKKKLEDYIVKYNELINKLPNYVDNNEELINICEELINICRNNLLQIEYIGQNFTEFIRLAEGVKDLLDTLSEMPREMIDMSALLADLNGIIAFSKMFEFCTKDALSLEGITIDAKELFKDISTGYSEFVDNVRDGVNKAKEAGYDTSKVENKLEELAEFEEALRHLEVVPKELDLGEVLDYLSELAKEFALVFVELKENLKKVNET